MTKKTKPPGHSTGRHYTDGRLIVVGKARHTPAQIKRAYMAHPGIRGAGASLGISGQRVIQIMRKHYPELIRPRGGKAL